MVRIHAALGEWTRARKSADWYREYDIGTRWSKMKLAGQVVEHRPGEVPEHPEGGWWACALDVGGDEFDVPGPYLFPTAAAAKDAVDKALLVGLGDAAECRCETCRPEPEPAWTVGVPSVDEVAEHEEAGGRWLTVDGEGDDATAVVSRLRVGNPGELAGVDLSENVEGAILIQNGRSFWQRLDECKWATRSRYTPCTREGVPVRWKA